MGHAPNIKYSNLSDSVQNFCESPRESALCIGMWNDMVHESLFTFYKFESEYIYFNTISMTGLEHGMFK